MVILTVNLNPPVTGIESKLYLVFGSGTQPIIDLPISVNGIIDASIGISGAHLDYTIIIPEQTLEGVTYRGSQSPVFKLVSDVTLSMNLNPLTPPTTPPTTPPPLPPVEYGDIVVPAILGIVGLLVVIRSL